MVINCCSQIFVAIVACGFGVMSNSALPHECYKDLFFFKKLLVLALMLRTVLHLVWGLYPLACAYQLATV